MTGSRGGSAWWPLVFGVVLLLVGGAFLLRNLGVVRLDWGILWPLILLITGAVVLVAALRGPARGHGSAHVVVPADGISRLELLLRLGAVATGWARAGRRWWKQRPVTPRSTTRSTAGATSPESACRRRAIPGSGAGGVTGTG